MFTTPLRIEAQDTPGEWKLIYPLVWAIDGDGYRMPDIEVPAGFVTDLASVPKLLRGLLDPTDPSRRPAVLHDWLYCSQNKHDYTRQQADALFRVALRADGSSAVAAFIYHAGVRAGGWRYWKKRSGGLTIGDFADLQS